MTAAPITPERRRALCVAVETLTASIKTDAAEFRRLLRSFLRRPQLVYLRELLRTGPARRSPDTEAAWKGLRQALLPVLEKGEVQESELPWFLSWACRTTISRPLPPERTFVADRPTRPFDRPGDRPGRPEGPPDRPGHGTPPRGGPGRDGFNRGRPDRHGDRPDRGGPVKMPPQPREVDSRWDLLKKFQVEEGEERRKK